MLTNSKLRGIFGTVFAILTAKAVRMLVV
jgi:hypothetical protein